MLLVCSTLATSPASAKTVKTIKIFRCFLRLHKIFRQTLKMVYAVNLKTFFEAFGEFKFHANTRSTDNVKC